MLSLIYLTLCLLHYVFEHAIDNGHHNGLDRTADDEHNELNRTDGGDFFDDAGLVEWLAQYDMDQVVGEGDGEGAVGFVQDADQDVVEMIDADDGDDDDDIVGAGYINENGYWYEDPFWAGVQDDSSDDDDDDDDMYYDVDSDDSGLDLDDGHVDFRLNEADWIAGMLMDEGQMPEDWDAEIEEVQRLRDVEIVEVQRLVENW